MKNCNDCAIDIRDEIFTKNLYKKGDINMVTQSRSLADYCICQPTTPTTIIQKFRLLFKKKQSIDTVVYKNELTETTHHINYKMLNNKKFILMDYYGETITLPDIQIICKKK